MDNFRTRFREARDQEVVDPHPHELMTPDTAPPTLQEQIKSAIRSEISLIAEAKGFESFEDSDDFSEDDPEADQLTIYEQVLMTPETDESLDGEATPTGTPPTSLSGHPEDSQEPQNPEPGPPPAEPPPWEAPPTEKPPPGEG